MLWLFLACETATPDDTANDTATTGTGEYVVEWSTEPAPPEAAGITEITAQVLGPDGAPVRDLILFHGAFLHTFLIPKDLSAFGHAHQEDDEEVSGEDLDIATFKIHAEFPVGGPYLVDFDFAQGNSYLSFVDSADVVGEPMQGDAPVENDATSVVAEGLTASIAWSAAPIAGVESVWTLHLVDDLGADVTDIVQWGGADAHVEMVDFAGTSFYHTHAYFPGMADSPPGHDMPHVYPGPDIEFHYVFPAAGRYRMWIQFARESVEEEFTLPFDVVVG